MRQIGQDDTLVISVREITFLHHLEQSHTWMRTNKNESHVYITNLTHGVNISVFTVSNLGELVPCENLGKHKQEYVFFACIIAISHTSHLLPLPFELCLDISRQVIPLAIPVYM